MQSNNDGEDEGGRTHVRSTRGRGAVDVSLFFFFSSRRRHTRLQGDWSSDVCSSDLDGHLAIFGGVADVLRRRALDVGEPLLQRRDNVFRLIQAESGLRQVGYAVGIDRKSVV